MEIVEGVFIKVLFPTHEKPRVPGLPHICYCIGVAPPIALVAYSTSRLPDQPLPRGVRIFGTEEAKRLNQIPFALYVNRLAKIALTVDWFPDIRSPDKGVIAIADQTLQDEIQRMLQTLMRKHRELVQTSGLE